MNSCFFSRTWPNGSHNNRTRDIHRNPIFMRPMIRYQNKAKFKARTQPNKKKKKYKYGLNNPPPIPCSFLIIWFHLSSSGLIKLSQPRCAFSFGYKRKARIFKFIIRLDFRFCLYVVAVCVRRSTWILKSSMALHFDKSRNHPGPRPFVLGGPPYHTPPHTQHTRASAMEIKVTLLAFLNEKFGEKKTNAKNIGPLNYESTCQSVLFVQSNVEGYPFLLTVRLWYVRV